MNTNDSSWLKTRPKKPDKDLTQAVYAAFAYMPNVNIESLHSDGFAPYMYTQVTVYLTSKQGDEARLTIKCPEKWDFHFEGTNLEWFNDCYNRMRDAYSDWAKEWVSKL